MQFALINKNKVEASPNRKGLCPHCLQPVFAKCGKQKVWHWAHNSKIACDKWWEPETEWHRAWKNNYPADWQEISLADEKTGEKHIADVRTSHNLVIEFQHSKIDPQERVSREKFYKNMVWIVDGTRREDDYISFLKGKNNRFLYTVFHKTDNPEIFRVDFPELCFPSGWLESSVPVIFDFRGDSTLNDPEGMRNRLYCLFPKIGKHTRVAEISHNAFINTTTNGKWSLWVSNFMDSFKKQDEIERQKQQQPKSRTISLRPLGSPLDRFIYKGRR